ncbi:hypothetical protein K435DRAFT_800154 [Dendrothele bispora CBS 962.96]|uniref:Uncharacterized protein n=1 Tax=Dendrothele bispora (strain CBS 962.96) TaxID=1314807 RepID=A0A4S8LTP1_DENBC|nr:hypothetical protein K435DRAFT_800154 [Dendrothele bispora CBS 962.96]
MEAAVVQIVIRRWTLLLVWKKRTKERKDTGSKAEEERELSSLGLTTRLAPFRVILVLGMDLGQVSNKEAYNLLSIDTSTLSLPSTPVYSTTFPNTRPVPDPPSLPSLSSLTGRFRRPKTAPGPSAQGQMSNCSYPSAPHPIRLVDPPKSRLKGRPSTGSDRITFPTSRSGDGGLLTNQSSDSTRHSLKLFPRTKSAAMSTRASVDELKSDFNCLSREEQQKLSPIAHKQAGSYGWKGKWNVDNMEVVIQKLRGLKRSECRKSGLP